MFVTCYKQNAFYRVTPGCYQREAGNVRVISFKIDEDLLEELNRYARERGVSRSSVLRAALRLYLDRVKGRRKPFVTKRIIIY